MRRYIKSAYGNNYGFMSLALYLKLRNKIDYRYCKTLWTLIKSEKSIISFGLPIWHYVGLR